MDTFPQGEFITFSSQNQGIWRSWHSFILLQESVSKSRSSGWLPSFFLGQVAFSSQCPPQNPTPPVYFLLTSQVSTHFHFLFVAIWCSSETSLTPCQINNVTESSFAWYVQEQSSLENQDFHDLETVKIFFLRCDVLHYKTMGARYFLFNSSVTTMKISLRLIV